MGMKERFDVGSRLEESISRLERLFPDSDSRDVGKVVTEHTVETPSESRTSGNQPATSAASSEL